MPVFIVVVAMWAYAQAQPPDTEIFLAPLTMVSGALTVGSPVNITASPGYDNQPSFTPDGAAILFTSARGAQPDTTSTRLQTDIYRYEIATQATSRITSTLESEYSPTVTPDGTHLSVIRVEADGVQRLWRFTRDGQQPELVLTDIKPVGYHAWADAQTLVLFVLGKPNTLQVADVRFWESGRRRTRCRPLDSTHAERTCQLCATQCRRRDGFSRAFNRRARRRDKDDATSRGRRRGSN